MIGKDEIYYSLITATFLFLLFSIFLTVFIYKYNKKQLENEYKFSPEKYQKEKKKNYEEHTIITQLRKLFPYLLIFYPMIFCGVLFISYLQDLFVL